MRYHRTFTNYSPAIGELRMGSFVASQAARRLIGRCVIGGVLGVFVSCALIHAAPPAAPSDTSATPTYNSNGTNNTNPNRPIKVMWDHNGANVTKFEIERSTDGTNFAKIADVPMNMTEYNDTENKDSTKTYHYRVRAANDDGNSGYSNVFATAIGVTWPLKADSHQLLQGFQDGSPNTGFTPDFHEGMDVLASGSGDEEVVISRAGKVVVKNEGGGNNGQVTIEVDVGGSKEYDTYLHLKTIPGAVAVNTILPEGADLGKISTTAFADGSRHLHFDIAINSSPNPTNMLNPFQRFTSSSDRDPLSNIPKLEDTNGDGKKLIIAKSGKTTPPGNFEQFDKQPIKDDVDIIADVRDKMHDSLLSASGPHKIGYHVKALFDQGVPKHDVRTAADPYLLAIFDDNWAANLPGTNAGRADKFKEVYADDGNGTNEGGTLDQDLRIDPNGTAFALTQQYVVTNTKGDTGRPDKVDGAQYWNTDAKDDNTIADTNDAANFAGKTDAAKNAEARFKDGEYEIHVILGDLINTTVDETAGKLRLDNFEQMADAKKCNSCIAPASGAVSPLYDLNNTTPYVPEFLPEPSSASIDELFDLGDEIGIDGEEYYPNLMMPAFIFKHRNAWNENDPLLNPIVEILVMSDPNGLVPLTRAWEVNRTGMFDVIIDYDRDRLFTWTMDGLGGFRVIPEPAAVSLAAFAMLGVIGFGRARPLKRMA